MFVQAIFSFLFTLIACDTTEITTTTRCNIDIPVIEENLYVGEAATIQAYPMTEKWDTLVEFDGIEADITSIKKENCEDCEECRELNSCTDCDYCSSCTDTCQACIHSVDVIVPTALSGDAYLVITNINGSSDPVPVSIQESLAE